MEYPFFRICPQSQAVACHMSNVCHVKQVFEHHPSNFFLPSGILLLITRPVHSALPDAEARLKGLLLEQ
jgi:hypothetical protein